MRYSRLVIGFVLIVITLWILVGEQIAGASGDAVINFRLKALRSTIAGTITMPPRALGSSVSLGEEVASVTDPLVDIVRLNDLAMEREFAVAEMTRLGAEAESISAQIAALKARGETYHTERLAEIETRLLHARARLALLKQGVADGRLLSGMVEEGQSGDQGDPRIDGIALEYARERVEVLEIALRAAQAGVFLGDGYNDAPYSEQRRNELETSRDGLAAKLTNVAARLDAIEGRITLERLRTVALGEASITSVVNGQVWQVLAGDGESVQRGQDVMRLIDCDTPLVTLSVTENIFNQLTVGDAAVFRFSGDGRSFDASVIRLAGSGAETLYQNLAVAPSQRHLERYDVALLVPALREAPELRCAVGRTGRAFFDARPLDRLRDLWR